jgi:hypothetical protein
LLSASATERVRKTADGGVKSGGVVFAVKR